MSQKYYAQENKNLNFSSLDADFYHSNCLGLSKEIDLSLLSSLFLSIYDFRVVKKSNERSNCKVQVSIVRSGLDTAVQLLEWEKLKTMSCEKFKKWGFKL